MDANHIFIIPTYVVRLPWLIERIQVAFDSADYNVAWSISFRYSVMEYERGASIMVSNFASRIVDSSRNFHSLRITDFCLRYAVGDFVKFSTKTTCVVNIVFVRGTPYLALFVAILCDVDKSAILSSTKKLKSSRKLVVPDPACSWIIHNLLSFNINNDAIAD